MVPVAVRSPRRHLQGCLNRIGIRLFSVLSGNASFVKKNDLRAAIAIAAWLAASFALAEDQAVPLYPPKEALQLSEEPRAYMVDDATCEWVQGQKLADGGLAGEGRKAALFRYGQLNRPFLRAETRADGVHVSRFPARAGEVIFARAYIIDPSTRRYVYGDVTQATCLAGKAMVGNPRTIGTGLDSEESKNSKD